MASEMPWSLQQLRATLEDFSPEQKEQVALELSHRLASVGLARWQKDHYEAYPITVLPTPFPRRLYEEGLVLNRPFALLCDSMSRNTQWLLDSFESLRPIDEFVYRLFNVVKRVYVDGDKDIDSCLRGYVARSDYFVDQATDRLKQVEINFSSVVGPFYMTQLTQLHKHMGGPWHYDPEPIPDQDPIDGVGKAIRVMFETYVAKYADVGRPAVLFVSQTMGDSNTPEMSQEIQQLEMKGIPVLWMTFGMITEAFVQSKVKVEEVSGPSPGSYKRLLVHSSLGSASLIVAEGLKEDWFEVTALYWRTAYDPSHYTSTNHWTFVEAAESARCFITPSSIQMLSGLKRTQQLWSVDSELKRLLPDDERSRAMLQGCFVTQVVPHEARTSLEVAAVVYEALEHPERFVLKPQREGGGHNYYNEDIPPILKQEVARESSSFILMRKIVAPIRRAVCLRRGRLEVLDAVSEFGCYFASIWDGNNEIYFDSFGYLLRTKSHEVGEGGVSINAGVLDTVYLL